MKIHIIMLFVTVMAKHPSHLHELIINQTKIYNHINVKTHNLLDQIFQSIQLDTNFSENPKIKVLLTMHNDLNNIIKNNYEVFQKIQNVSRVDFSANEKLKHKQQRSGNGYDIDVPKFNSKEVNELEKDEDIVTGKNLIVWEPDSYLSIETQGIDEGIKTSYQRFPFIASIHVKERFRCAGAIIKPDLVLTAAACLQLSYKDRTFKGNPKSIRVRVGSDSLNRYGEILKVQEVYIHPDYDPRTLKNNIVILRLKDHVNLKLNLKRIQLDKNEENLTTNDRIIILGWGSTQKDEVMKEEEEGSLKLAALDIYLFEGCKDLFSNEDILTENNFCAGVVDQGSPQDQDSRACSSRNMGGPGIVGNKLVGIISFGPSGCEDTGDPGAPTVFTKVGPYRGWIDSIINMVSPYDHPSPTPKQIAMYSLRRLISRTEDKLYSFKTHPEDTKPFQQNDNSSSPYYHSSEQEFSRESDFDEKINDEVKVMKHIIDVTSAEQALTDLIATNSSVITEILYEELFDDFNEYFTTTKRVEIFRPYIPLTTGTQKILTLSTTPKPEKTENEIPSNVDYFEEFKTRPQSALSDAHRNNRYVNPSMYESEKAIQPKHSTKKTRLNNNNLPMEDSDVDFEKISSNEPTEELTELTLNIEKLYENIIGAK